MMTIMGKRFNKRGVSVIIAALLLIAIAVAAAVLLYVFSIGLLGSLQGGGGQQVKDQLILEAYSWPLATGLTLTVRNVGTAPVTVADIFVNGVAQTTPTLVDVGSGLGCGNPDAGTVPLGAACTATFATFSGTPFSGSKDPTSGVAYPIKIVSADGGVFSYSAIAGQSS